MNLDNLDNGTSSIKPRNGKVPKTEVEQEENQFSGLFTKSPEELMQLATELGVDPAKISRKIDLLISLMSVIAERSDVLKGAGV